jgi:hypothetical protein
LLLKFKNYYMLFSNLTELGGEMGGSGGLDLRGVDWGHWQASDVDSTVVKWGSVGVISWGSEDNMSRWGKDGTSGENWSMDGMSEGNWGSQSNWSWGWSNWKVGGGNTESVDWISNIVHALDQTVSIDVVVSSTDNTISSPGLSLGGWTSSISVGVLTELILSMVLGSSWSNNSWGNESSAGDSHNGSKNDKDTHFDFVLGFLQKSPQGCWIRIV